MAGDVISLHPIGSRVSRGRHAPASHAFPRLPESPHATSTATQTMSSKLTPQAQRWRTILFTVPIIGVTSCACSYRIYVFATHSRRLLVVLYKRLVLGEPRRTLPTDLDRHGHEKVATILTSGGTGVEGADKATRE